MRIRLAVAVLAAAFAFGAPASAEDAPFKPQEFSLENGLQVVVIPDRRAPVVTQMVWYRIGSADEPRGKTGIAHFLEHLMFRGTPAMPDGEFSRTVAKNGGQDNAFTSYDYTAYHQRVAADRLGLVMEMEADRMANLGITDEVTTPERGVILEERDSRTDNNPEALFFERLYTAFYAAHPYRNPVIGWETDMAGLTTEDAMDFYRRYYAPNNAILVVAGDVTVERVRELAEATYGRLPRRETVARLRTPEPPPLGPRRFSMVDGRVGNPVLTRLYLAPGYAQAQGNEAYALELAAQILGGGDTSRFSRVLVKERKLASSASAWYEGDGVDARAIGVYAIPMPGVPVADLEAAVDAEIARFVAEGPTEDELARAKSVMTANAIYARDSQEGLANYYGAGLAIGRSLADLEAWPDRIAATTADEVKSAAAAYLRIERSATGVLEPDPNADGPVVAPSGGPPSGATER